MRKFSSTLILFFSVLICFAQHGSEAKLPLLRNFELNKYAESEASASPAKNKQQFSFKTGKADSSFPFIDRFTNPGTSLSIKNWSDINVVRNGQTAVFDALNSSGVVYPGIFGQADILTSKRIVLTSVTNLYVELNYSTGRTWSAGDSLVLQVQNSAGNWVSIWQSSTIATTGATATIAVDPVSLFIDANNTFIRFVNYTGLLPANTEDFILNYVVFARKTDLPFYDNITSYSFDTFPSKENWAIAKSAMYRGYSAGIDWGNTVVFDSYDENRNVYNNANGQRGFADTLQSHSFDLTSYDVSDSVYLRFYCKAMPNSSSADSLVLEYRNNGGVWIRAASFNGAPFNNFRTYIQQINFGKLRSSAFQFRLINKCSYLATDTLKWIASGFHIGKKLLIPIVDDFSSSSMFPDQNLWTGKSVYINNHFPVRPPSFNVATFDGLDFRGNPYGAGRGYCDTLTSLPINLSDIPSNDTSVYLSFYVEPQGNGDLPNSRDSIVVEMRRAAYDPVTFTTRWNAAPSAFRTDSFMQVFIRIDSAYFHDDFQFRIKNIGSLTGNLHHWNVDYIRLDKGRFENDRYRDVAITENPTTLLKKYSSMPWSHFDTSAFRSDTQFFALKNNFDVTYAITFFREVLNQQPAVLDTFRNTLSSFVGGTEEIVFAKNKFNLTPFISGDTISFTTKFSIKVGTTNDNIRSNDSISAQTDFSNYFAYDDGSAEAGYAVKNYPGSVALGYSLTHPDTLYGIAVFFNQSSTDVSGRPFNFMVWKEVGLPPSSSGESVLARLPFTGPHYMSKLNGFYYYKFGNPVPVDGKFYIGWEQTQIFELNVGLDQNFRINKENVPNPEMYYKTTDVPVWQQTQLTGALMMRPIVGKWIDPPVGVSEPQTMENRLTVYPNPAKDILNIKLGNSDEAGVELFDFTGRLILKEKPNQNMISISGMKTGIYILKITDLKSGQVYVRKILINE